MDILLIFSLFIVVSILFFIQYPYSTIIPVILMLIIVSMIIVLIKTQQQREIIINLIQPIFPKRFNILPSLKWEDLSSLSSIQKYINNAIEKEDNTGNREISNAMKDAVRGGKRIRAALVLDVAARSINSVNPVDATEAALAIEYLHAASLIIDDMPHFDNDMIRRGEKSIHDKYGLATAQMAATCLTAKAMECLVRQTDKLKETDCIEQLIKANESISKLLFLMSNCLGINGASIGQLEENIAIKDNKKCDIEDIINKKTGAIFEASLMAGWIVSSSVKKYATTSNEIKLLKTAAYSYGMAFQIADDIGDEEKDVKNGNGNINYCHIYGRERSIRKFKEQLKLCKENLEELSLWSPIWEDAFKLARSKF